MTPFGLPAVNLLGDRDVLALTLDGEAEGEPIEGIIAVASVIRNRLVGNPHRFGATYVEVCLKPEQFSCWNPLPAPSDYARVMSLAAAIADGQPPMDAPFRQCLYVATGIISGELLSNVRDATHYVTAALAASPAAPLWVRQSLILAHKGTQVFMRA